MTLVLFDFDGTVTNRDTMIGFIQYAVGKPIYYIGLLMLSPILLGYKLNLIPNYIAKEKMISYFFKGWDLISFDHLAEKYSVEEIDRITRPKAIEKINWHLGKDHKVVVVSASIDSWLKKWCEQKNIELIATRLEVKSGKLTGKLATKNCHGIEKVNFIKERFDLSKYDSIYAYGDSSGDKEMFKIATKKYYKCFH